MKDCTFPRCGCSEREQCRPEDALKAALARAEAAEAEVKKLKAGSNWLQKQFHENLENLVKEMDRVEAAERQRDEAFTAGAEAMREALLGKVDFSEVGFDYVSHGTISALPIPAQEK